MSLLYLFVVAEADVVAGCGVGVPGDVEPGGAGQELVGIFATAEECDKALELLRVLGTDVGGLAKQVLRVTCDFCVTLFFLGFV